MKFIITVLILVGLVATTFAQGPGQTANLAPPSTALFKAEFLSLELGVSMGQMQSSGGGIPAAVPLVAGVLLVGITAASPDLLNTTAGTYMFLGGFALISTGVALIVMKKKEKWE